MVNKSLSRSAVNVAALTALFLMIPAVAMLFTGEFNWGSEDFLAAGGLLFGGGMAYVLGARFMRTSRQRLVMGLLVLAGVALIWAELAVGIFT